MVVDALSHIGKKRTLNEDSYFMGSNNAYAYGFVADGMGGHQAGEIASSMACQIVKEQIEENFHPEMECAEAARIIQCAFIDANSKIYEYAVANSKMMGMGTTATFAMIYHNKLITAHVGDSRVYMIKDDIRQITKDHSYVQELLSHGEISEEMARNHPKKNYITRAVGTEETVKVDVSINDYDGGIVLICSDGLTNMILNDDIQQIVTTAESLKDTVEKLIAAANENGGIDNITVVLISKDREMNV